MKKINVTNNSWREVALTHEISYLIAKLYDPDPAMASIGVDVITKTLRADD